MTGEKIKEIVAKYDEILGRYGARSERNMSGVDLHQRLNHLAWMCEQINNFVGENRLDKAFRWLGFIQGAFWAYGIQNIEDSKRDNSPVDVPFDAQRV